MFKWIILSTRKIYQQDFPKVVILKSSTKGAMRSSFRKVPCK